MKFPIAVLFTNSESDSYVGPVSEVWAKNSDGNMQVAIFAPSAFSRRDEVISELKNRGYKVRVINAEREAKFFYPGVTLPVQI